MEAISVVGQDMEQRLREAEARVAELTRAQGRAEHLRQVLLGIRNVNQLIVSEPDARRLAQRACACLTETMGYHNAWMALLDQEGRVWATALSGYSEGLNGLRGRLEAGTFPACMRAALGAEGIVAVDDPLEHCADCPASCEQGGRAGLACQLRHGGRRHGVLSVSVPASFARDEEEHSLFRELADDIAYALSKIETEAAARRDHQRLANVVDGAGLGTWEWNVQTGDTVFNERWAGMLGRTLEELQPYSYSTWVDLVHPDDLAQAEQALARCVEGETPSYSCEFRMRHKQGHWVWILDKGSVMASDGDGKPLLMHGTHADITRLKEAEQAARAREQYLHTILQTTADGLWILDVGLRVVEVNAAYCAMTGRAREEVLGLHVTDLDPDEDPAEAREKLDRIRRAGSAIFTRTHRRKDGSAVHVEISASWLDVDGGRVVCFCRDLSERRLREEQIALQGRMLDEAPVAISVHDEGGRFLYVNRESVRMHGHTSEEELLATTLHSIDVPESERVFDERVRRIQEQGEANFEVEHFRRDGSRFPLEVHAKVIDWHGQGALLSIATDISERKRAERAAREAALMLQEAVQAAHVGLWSWNLRTNAVWYSDEWKRQVGHEPGEVSNDLEEWRRRVHPDDLGPAMERIEHTIREVRPDHNSVFRFRHKDGSWRWILAQATVLLGEDGKPARMLGSHLDVTEARLSEEQLRFASHALAQLSIGVYWMDEAGRFVSLNDAACRNLGYTREELMALDITALAPGSPPSFWAEHWEAMKRDRACTFQRLHCRKDGSSFPVEINANFVAFEGREQICALVTDITQRKRAEEALRESEARFATAFRSSPAPLVLSEIDTGLFLDVNDRWVEMLEFSRDEQVGRPSKEVGIWESPAERDRLVRQLRKQGRLRDEPIDFRAKSGRAIPALWSAEVVRVGGRDVMLSMITDLTRIRAAEAEQASLAEQLNQAQRLESVGRLAGGVAHDFNNMLNVILGNAELLQDLLPAGGKARGHLEEIHSAGKRSADLTRQLLAFARKQVVEPRVLDLNDVVASMLRMVQRLIGEHIALDWRPSAEAATVRVDPAQVDQVLANLCVNARDAIGQRPGRIAIQTGVVHVEAAAAAAHEGVDPGPFVVLSISDDGCGIPHDVLAHLFEPFFTTKPVGEGTGLGLATVYGIVRQNKGFIEVRSRAGAGTTFLVHLPAHHEASAPVAKAPPPPVPRGQGTVLLVEDEPAILRMTSTMLARLGYTVLAAGSPGEALELAAAAPGKIDLLVTDVVMPQMNGRDLAGRLAASQPAMKRLFMSGYTADVIAHQGVLDAGVSFLQKPFTMRDLGRKTREALGP